ncbi:MAG: circularly permuted type 2 ATP-grasp protein [Gemmatimonadaceae bacterium]|nr:circularly permuted type 2 ATP-grasp protein [Gemmatimonadaceae bacterium]
MSGNSFSLPIARYHELLTPALAEASHEWLHDLLVRSNLVFGERLLCSVLRPRFLTHGQYRHIARTSHLVLTALESVRVAAMADPALRAQFALQGWEEQLVHVDPGYPVASPTSRLDAFFAHGQDGLKFTEFNAETPAGAGYNDALTDVFLALPVMAEFSRSYACTPAPAAPGVVHALLSAFQSWRGTREKPVVAILDWADVPTRSEFELFQARFRALGIDCLIDDPRHCEYRDGRLHASGTPVSLIYKRVLIDELVERCGIEHDVVRAVRDGAVCMVNSFPCKVLHKKASLAVVSDERNQHLLDEHQQAAVRAHVPWTRVMEERKTLHRGREIDLLPWVAANRERLVLKPNDEYGGKGIVLGWTVDSEHWQAAIRTALASPHIVQERVEVPSEPFPAWVDGSLAIGDRMLDTAPYMSGGVVMEGCLTRISQDPLLNVTAGGGSNVPTFLVEER